MVSGLAIGLTVDGMQQLSDELAIYAERRTILAGALSSSPDDLGELQGELAVVDRRIAEIQSVLARAQPIAPPVLDWSRAYHWRPCPGSLAGVPSICRAGGGGGAGEDGAFGGRAEANQRRMKGSSAW